MKAELLHSSTPKPVREPVSIDVYNQKPVSAATALQELYELLEAYSPMWYSEETHLRARAALRQITVH